MSFRSAPFGLRPSAHASPPQKGSTYRRLDANGAHSDSRQGISQRLPPAHFNGGRREAGAAGDWPPQSAAWEFWIARELLDFTFRHRKYSTIHQWSKILFRSTQTAAQTPVAAWLNLSEPLPGRWQAFDGIPRCVKLLPNLQNSCLRVFFKVPDQALEERGSTAARSTRVA